MDRRSFVTGLILATTGAVVATEAHAQSWYSLGVRRVNGLVDVDRINVGAGAGVFDAIRLRVTGNDLMIYDLEVVYGNGAHDDIPVRLLIPEGGMTRVIDLRLNNRFIRYVRFTYGKFPNGQGPTYVELRGRR